MTATPMTTTVVQGSTTEIDSITAKRWLDAGDALLIDVRESFEHAGLSIPGAVSLPLGDVSVDALPDLNERKLIVHCLSGSRGQQACEKLTAAGLEIYHLAGGINAWQDAGLPTHRNKKAPIDMFRQVQIVVGSFVLLFTLLAVLTGWLWFLAVPIFFGSGLLFAGISGFCGLALILGKMPWNRVTT